MIAASYAHAMARYNQWQNDNLFGRAELLSDAERRRDAGAFFGSIHATLSHLLWGDRIWLHRFTGSARPPGGIKESVELVASWDVLRAQRRTLDDAIIAWAGSLDPAWLDGGLTYYSGAIGADVTKPRWLLVVHMFNNQTHHRGQVHCLLTQAGLKPSDTDIPFMPEPAS